MHTRTDTDIDIDTHMCAHAHACTDACMHIHVGTHTNAHRLQFLGHTGVHQLSAYVFWFKNLHDV